MGGHSVTQDAASGGTSGYGAVEPVDAQKAGVYICHSPIPALSWPAMTTDLPV